MALPASSSLSFAPLVDHVRTGLKNAICALAIIGTALLAQMHGDQCLASLFHFAHGTKNQEASAIGLTFIAAIATATVIDFLNHSLQQSKNWLLSPIKAIAALGGFIGGILISSHLYGHDSMGHQHTRACHATCVSAGTALSIAGYWGASNLPRWAAKLRADRLERNDTEHSVA